ncbi:MAG: hypothetical protein CMP81_05330 [Fulvimarina sp.]|nr:hypothetical protein [Fulvimarina sp.]
MDEPLKLSLPKADEHPAPKKRFATGETTSRLNTLNVLPFLIIAFSGLIKKMFGAAEETAQEDQHPASSPHPEQAATLDPDPATAIDSADVGETGEIGKVIRLAEYLKSITPPQPMASIVSSNLVFHPVERGPGATPPSSRLVNPPQIDPASGVTVPISHYRGPVPGGSVNNGGRPTGNRPGEAGSEDPEAPAEPGRSNRRPTLNGPVLLDDGLLDMSIVITMSELLAGASDADGDILSVAGITVDTGHIEQIASDRWLYTPPDEMTGPVAFAYQVTDGHDAVAQTASLTLRPIHGDEIVGTDGDDVILGTPYDDIIDARGGDDIVYGRESDDAIRGGDGDDRLIGGEGDDVIWGGRGNDVIFGGAGDDTLFGGDGNDTLFGDAGEDRLIGGEGDDEAHGGKGNDEVDGGAGDDLLFGDAGFDTIDGGAGADNLDGGAGDDILTGGDGDDEVHGGDGTDVMDGGAGDDLLFGDEGSDTINGGAGADSVDGGTGDDVLTGGDGDDAVTGGIGDDTLDGGAGNDVLEGGDGADLLVDGDGHDRLDGGTGDDRIVLVADGVCDDVHGGDGDDTLDLYAFDSDLVVDLPDGTVSVHGSEEARFFEIENVIGGSGCDRIVADDHVNVMSGGAGDDVFVFRSLEALNNHGGPSDHVVDFEVGDRIDLSRLIGDGSDFAATRLFFAGAAAAPSDELGAVTFDIRFLEDGHVATVLVARLDDDPEADFTIVLDGRHELTESDFILAAREDDAPLRA